MEANVFHNVAWLEKMLTKHFNQKCMIGSCCCCISHWNHHQKDREIEEEKEHVKGLTTKKNKHLHTKSERKIFLTFGGRNDKFDRKNSKSSINKFFYFFEFWVTFGCEHELPQNEMVENLLYWTDNQGLASSSETHWRHIEAK